MRKPHPQKRQRQYVPANEQIKARQVLLVDEEGGSQTVVETATALAQARQQGLDLVLIAPQANPPVAKILDYGKFRYEKEREARAQKRNSNNNDLKEIRLSPQMEPHDFEQRVKRASSFIAAGHRIRLSMRFRGRQIVFKERGLELLQQFADRLNLEMLAAPKLTGKVVNVLLQPKKR